MATPRKKKMGRPLEDVPLRKLIKSIRQDIEGKLEAIAPVQDSLETSKPKRKYKLTSSQGKNSKMYSLRQVNNNPKVQSS